MKKIKKYLTVLALLLTVGGVVSTTKIANAQSIRYKYIHKDRNGKVRTRKDKVQPYQLIFSKDKNHVIALIDDDTPTITVDGSTYFGSKYSQSDGLITMRTSGDSTLATQLYLIDSFNQQGYHLVSTSSRDLMRTMQVRLYFEK